MRGAIGGEQRTRALLKVVDGCDRFCAYCIIPYARGGVRSKPEAEILREAEGLVKAGYKELILTGINLPLYGQDRRTEAGLLRYTRNDGAGANDEAGAGNNLYKLVKKMCAISADREFRVRLGSLEPTVITAEDAEGLAGIKGVCPQFHLSLQSGCEKTLKSMGRNYTPEDFEAIVTSVRKIDPLFSITTDVIVGFPGETDADFEESAEFVRRIGFAKIHVFKYSKRPGTKAVEMTDQISEELKQYRGKVLAGISEKGKKDFIDKNIGNARRTLILGQGGKSKNIRGLTDNGIDINLPDDLCEFKKNEFYTIVLKEEMAFFVE